MQIVLIFGVVAVKVYELSFYYCFDFPEDKQEAVEAVDAKDSQLTQKLVALD